MRLFSNLCGVMAVSMFLREMSAGTHNIDGRTSDLEGISQKVSTA